MHTLCSFYCKTIHFGYWKTWLKLVTRKITSYGTININKLVLMVLIEASSLKTHICYHLWLTSQHTGLETDLIGLSTHDRQFVTYFGPAGGSGAGSGLADVMQPRDRDTAAPATPMMNCADATLTFHFNYQKTARAHDGWLTVNLLINANFVLAKTPKRWR